MLKFGTSGLRGLNTELTDKECYLYTCAFLEYLKKNNHIKNGQNKIAIAGDLRPSTKQIMTAVSTACQDSGLTVINCGKAPTPTVSLYGFKNYIPSVMITGSHIPFDRNGIKFNMPYGEVLKSDEQQITKEYERVSSDTSLLAKFDTEGTLLSKNDLPEESGEARQNYINRYVDFFPQKCLQNKTIVFYQHSSAVRDIFPGILESLGAKVVNVKRSDEFVPIDTEAIADEDIERAKKWTKEFNPDAIMSTDGDSDRPLLFDEQGDFIRGDILGIYCAMYLGADSVSTTVSCNTALEKSGLFTNINRTKIGSPYVIEAMNEDLKAGRKKVVSYEANGGFLTASEIEMDGKKLSALPTRDAVLPLLCVLMLAKKYKTTLSGLKNLLPQRFVYSQSIKGIPTEKSKEILARLTSADNEAKKLATKLFNLPAEIKKFDFTDGARMTLENEEIVHARPSGNAPELRIYCESDSFERSKELVEIALGAINKLA